MRLTKIKGAVLASIIVLSVGVIAVKAAPAPTYAKEKVTTMVQPTETDLNESTSKVTPIVISNSKYKKVNLLSKTDIEQMTGVALTTDNVNAIYKELKKESTWEKAGYNESDSDLIASRFTISYKQSIGILNKLAKVSKLSLKVVIIDKPSYQNASIGVAKNNTNPETPTITPTVTPTTTPTPSIEASKSTLKELEISIDYKNGDIELEYEIDLDGTIKAEFKNDFTGEDLKDKDAQVKIEEILTGLNIKESNETIIVDHILNKLNIDKEFEEFEFKVEFHDGKEFEFEK